MPLFQLIVAHKIYVQPQMDTTGSSARSHIGEEYVRFFQTLSILDVQKVQILARHLHSLYDQTTKLDRQLAPTGAVIHIAVSRMCEAENALAAPQHRWIREFDLLGFFSDALDHACRIVDIGLSYAYRHKELNVLTTTNALRLRALSDPSTSGQNASSGVNSEPQEVPPGGVSVSARPGTPRYSCNEVDASSKPPDTAVQSLVIGIDGSNQDGTVAESDHDQDDAAPGLAGDDSDILLPDGGLVVRRSGAKPIHSEADKYFEEPEVGGCGIVVSTRPPLRAPQKSLVTADMTGQPRRMKSRERAKLTAVLPPDAEVERVITTQQPQVVE